MLSKRLGSVAAAGAALLLMIGSAVGQCDTASTLENYGAPPGTDGDVKAMTVWDPDGPGGSAPNLMVLGGTFNQAGNLSAVHGLVGWDGTQFVRVPTAVVDTALLTTWAPFGASNVARWIVQISSNPDPVFATFNGTNWTNITNISGYVNAVTTWDPDGPGGVNPWVMVAGHNLQVGNVGPASLLKFDGTTWTAVGTVSGGSYIDIFALETWDPDGSGAAFNDCLAIAGSFDHVAINGASSNPTANNVCFLQYNPAAPGGFNESTMSGGVTGANGGFPSVYALKAWDVGGGNKRLVIGGNFANAAGVGGADGLVWYSVTNLTTGNYYAVDAGSAAWQVQKMESWNPQGSVGTAQLVVYGSNPAHTGPVFTINTSGVVTSVTSDVEITGLYALGVWDVAGDGLQPQWLFAGGSGGNVPFNHITRINTGNHWIPLPNLGPDVLPATGSVNAVVGVSNFTTTNPQGTFVGGAFDHAGPIAVNNVAVWGGSSWGSVGNGLNGAVISMNSFTSGIGVTRATTVYAGGSFTASGSTALSHIAHLTGGPISTYTWNAMGSGVNNDVYSIIQFDPDGSGPLPSSVVVGGLFTTAGGSVANRIAYWNPSAQTWGTFGTGFNGAVTALVSWDPDGSGPLGARLLAGGAFTTASGITVGYLAWWDGIQWQPFEGGGLNGPVTSLMVWPDPANPAQPRLVIGGRFTQAGGTPANNVAVWRPSGWITAMGSGVTESVSGTLPLVTAVTSLDLDGPNSPPASQGADLVIGGTFDHNGQGDTLSGLARWDAASQRWTSMGTWNGVKMLRPWNSNADGRPTLLVGGRMFRNDLAEAVGLAVRTGNEPYTTAAPAPTTAACNFSNVVLNVTAVGGSLVYRWQRNGVNLNNGATESGSSIAGVDTTTLTITNAGPADSGSYTLNIFSPCGNTATNPTVLTVQQCCGSADFNCDGDSATDADIEAFFNCVAGNCPAAPCSSSADFDDDGDAATDADIEAFFRVIAGGHC